MTKRIDILVPNEDGFRNQTTEQRQVIADVRDAGKAVLVALEKWGVLGQGQIEGLLFNKEMDSIERAGLFFNGTLKGRHHRSSYKVLKRLEAARLVRIHGFANVSLYTLTGRGHAFMRQQGMSRLPGFRGSISPALVPHEMLSNGVGLTLNALLGLPVSAEFERYIRSRHAKNGASMRRLKLPDLWVSDGKSPKAIEVERTLKDFDRYRQLWNTYRAGLPREVVVLYIAAWPNGARAILSRARDLLMDFIYACDLADFVKSLGTCPFLGYRGGQIQLGARTNHPQRPQPQRAPLASIPARQDVSAGDMHTIVTCAAPSQSDGLGTLIRPASGPDQSATPLVLRPFPRPHPRTPSPTPEGTDRYRWPNAGNPKGGGSL